MVTWRGQQSVVPAVSSSASGWQLKYSCEKKSDNALAE